MYHTWDKLLFLHWPIEAERLRPLIPPRLTIDTFDGAAWIGVVPFKMRGIRHPFAPPLPGVSRSHELNVRTYVHSGGVPGVWFLSLDAANPLVVWGARASYFLPYFRAEMHLDTCDTMVHFRSRRTDRRTPPAEFAATWTVGKRIAEAKPGSLEFFLTERYCLYAARGRRLYQARIYHRPWPLATAEVTHLASTMTLAHGLTCMGGAPLVHALVEPIDVEVWRPKRT
jgi:uncharacterized protein YqjF (DUF2071 family)